MALNHKKVCTYSFQILAGPCAIMDADELYISDKL